MARPDLAGQPLSFATAASVLSAEVGPGSGPEPWHISWVTLERWAREKVGPPRPGRRPCRDDAEPLTDEQLLAKLHEFGVTLDRAELESLCQDALSVEAVAAQLLDHHVPAAGQSTPESDWIWLALLALWQRWWPTKPCLETIDDKIQGGYGQLAQDVAAATDTWLEAWHDVLHLCSAAGVTTVSGFDAQFPMTQSLFNWHQDLEMELGNAGVGDPAKLHARIAVGEEFLRRFTDCDDLAVENWRRAIAEAWFRLGETDKADQLYRAWLDDDPQWGFGWVGWATGYLPPTGMDAPVDAGRAEELLRQGLAVPGVRDRDAISNWLEQARKRGEHPAGA